MTDTNTAEREAFEAWCIKQGRNIKRAIEEYSHEYESTMVQKDWEVWQACAEAMRGFDAADMATASAQGFRDGVASLAASAAPLSCGHPASMMLMSAETGDPLYCELCDSIDRRRDAETREAELQQQLVDMKSINAQLIDALKTVRSQESDLWAPWLIKQVDAALAKCHIAEHASASLAASAGSEPVAWRAQFDAWWSNNRVGTHQVKNIGGFASKVWCAAIKTVVGATDSTAGFYPADEGSTPSRQATHPSPPEGMAGWISVDERLPQPFTTVLIHPRPTDYCCEGEVNTQRQWSYGEYETGFGHHQIKCKVTHWQPLPTPPLPAYEAKEL